MQAEVAPKERNELERLRSELFALENKDKVEKIDAGPTRGVSPAAAPDDAGLGEGVSGDQSGLGEGQRPDTGTEESKASDGEGVGSGRDDVKRVDPSEGGEPTTLTLYRGLNRKDVKNKLAPRDGYNVFASTNPDVAASYSGSDGEVVPFTVDATEVIEFPVGRTFNKTEFDRRAKQLKKGQVLVARNVTDTGPLAECHRAWYLYGATRTNKTKTQHKRPVSRDNTF